MTFKKFLPFLLLICAGAFIYSFNLNNELLWDDEEWIINNIFVHSFNYVREIFTENILAGYGLESNYYRPLLSLTFAVNYVIGKDSPLGYHLLSNFLHVMNGVLLYVLLLRILKNKTIALFSSLFFIVHPVNVEAVAYVSGRGDPLSAFFILLSLLAFIYSQIKDGLKLYFASLLFLVLALLSRENALITPGLIFLLSLFISKEDNLKSWIYNSLTKSMPFFGISIFYFVLRLTVLNFENTLNFFSQGNAYTGSIYIRLLTFCHALLEYMKMIFVPLNLHMERTLPIKESLWQWPVPLAILLIIIIASLGYVLYRLKGFKNISFRLNVLSWGWFFVALIPVSGIIPINAILYEHWLYLPIMGFSIFLGWLISKLLTFLQKISKYYYFLVIIILIGYFSFLSYVSIQRNIIWGKQIEFYEDILKYNPKNTRVLNNLSNVYLGKGDIIKSEEILNQIVNQDDSVFAQPFYNLANIYRDRKEINKAIELYKKAIEVDPRFPFPYQNLAVIYADKGMIVQAGEMLEKVKEIKPQDPRVYYNLALIYIAQGNADLAALNIKEGILRATNDQEAKDSLNNLNKLINDQIR